jgi:phage antirepressor YoqD-like protein
MGTVDRGIVTGEGSAVGHWTYNNGMQIVPSASQTQVMTLESMDADGFTIKNTKYSSPTGTARIHWFACG